jgi:catalase
VLYDAVYVPGGSQGVQALGSDTNTLQFINEAFGHAKAIAASGHGVELLARAGLPKADLGDTKGEARDVQGVVTAADGAARSEAQLFVDAIAKDRHWEREPERKN